MTLRRSDSALASSIALLARTASLPLATANDDHGSASRSLCPRSRLSRRLRPPAADPSLTPHNLGVDEVIHGPRRHARRAGEECVSCRIIGGAVSGFRPPHPSWPATGSPSIRHHRRRLCAVPPVRARPLRANTWFLVAPRRTKPGLLHSVEGRDETTGAMQGSTAQCTCPGGVSSGGERHDDLDVSNGLMKRYPFAEDTGMPLNSISSTFASADEQIIHADRSALHRVGIIIWMPVVRDRLAPPADNTCLVVDASACGMCTSGLCRPHPCARLHRRSDADDDNLAPIPDMSAGSLMGGPHQCARLRQRSDADDDNLAPILTGPVGWLANGRRARARAETPRAGGIVDAVRWCPKNDCRAGAVGTP
ncbi:hypothetical protein MSAN_00777900 [Mycena sanguinolenta]|uniref:Uncharacterized protein n=1 Tax=Mycena sanguinolenta TaxID=230812 RepID=A0A8H7DFQ1_9AGAR|nr:hypothetical protein MSAN_00777900 [Mycena sanguinolenta]